LETEDRKKGDWETIFLFRELDKGTTYYFSIEALGEMGNSGIREEVEVK